jgi:hypothetical protein
VLSDLSGLSPVEYGQKRFKIAEQVGVPRSLLDLEYRERRKNAKNTEGNDVDFLRDADPWPACISGDELLKEIAATAAKHLVLPDGGAEIMALWAVFTHCHDCFQVSPLLAFTSPTPECGKTTCLTFLAGVSQRPLNTSNITSAALFRAVEKWTPTLLVDEADTFIRDSDELRGVINSGHQRSNAFVIRTVGDNHEPKRFCTWGPKAIALIGKLPATLASRAVHIELKRMRNIGLGCLQPANKNPRPRQGFGAANASALNKGAIRLHRHRPPDLPAELRKGGLNGQAVVAAPGHLPCHREQPCLGLTKFQKAGPDFMREGVQWQKEHRQKNKRGRKAIHWAAGAVAKPSTRT